MTEAELQCLAEIIAGLAPQPAPPAFNYWQLLIAFIAGVLVNSVTDFNRDRAARRQKLREARARLLQALTDFQWLIAVENPEWGIALSDRTIQRVRQLSRDELWQRIIEAISAGNDRKYGRLIYKKLRYTVFESSPAGRASEFRRVQEIVKRLEPEALALPEQLHDEILRQMRRHSAVNRWLFKLRYWVRERLKQLGIFPK